MKMMYRLYKRLCDSIFKESKYIGKANISKDLTPEIRKYIVAAWIKRKKEEGKEVREIFRKGKNR